MTSVEWQRYCCKLSRIHNKSVVENLVRFLFAHDSVIIFKLVQAWFVVYKYFLTEHKRPFGLIQNDMRDLRLSPRLKLVLLLSGLLRGVRYFETDVSGLNIGSTFKRQALPEEGRGSRVSAYIGRGVD